MAVTAFNFTQSVASATWNIAHNLNCYPCIDVIVDITGTPTKIIPEDIIIVDLNNVQIVFTQAYSGWARLI